MIESRMAHRSESTPLAVLVCSAQTLNTECAARAGSLAALITGGMQGALRSFASHCGDGLHRLADFDVECRIFSAHSSSAPKIGSRSASHQASSAGLGRQVSPMMDSRGVDGRDPHNLPFSQKQRLFDTPARSSSAGLSPKSADAEEVSQSMQYAPVGLRMQACRMTALMDEYPIDDIE